MNCKRPHGPAQRHILRKLRRCPRYGSSAVGVFRVIDFTDKFKRPDHRVTAEYANEARKAPARFRVVRDRSAVGVFPCNRFHGQLQTARTSSHRGIREQDAEGHFARFRVVRGIAVVAVMLLSVESPDLTATSNSQNIESPRNTRTRRGRALRALPRCPRNCSCGSYAVVRGITGSHGNLKQPEHRVTAEYANEARKGTPRASALSAIRQFGSWRFPCNRFHGQVRTARTSSHRGIRERGAEGHFARFRVVRDRSAVGVFPCNRFHGQLQTARTSSHRGKREQDAEGHFARFRVVRGIAVVAVMLLSVESPDLTATSNSQNIESPRNTRTRRGRALRAISRCPRNCSCGSYAVVRGITGSHGQRQTAGHRVGIAVVAVMLLSVESPELTDNDKPPDIESELQLWQLCCCPWNHRISRTTLNRRTIESPRNTRTRRGRDRPRASALSAIQQFGSWRFPCLQRVLFRLQRLHRLHSQSVSDRRRRRGQCCERQQSRHRTERSRIG